MKKKTVFGTLLFVLLVLQAQTVFANGESESSSSSSSNSRPAPEPPPRWANVVLTGENEPFLEGTTWISLAWDGRATIEFRDGGQLVRRIRSSDGTRTYTDTWSREGDIVRMIFGNGATLFEGKYYPQTKRIMGTLYFSDGSTDEDTWEPQQGSSLATQAPQTNVQPAAPAQNPAPAPAPSAPTFQTGTYSWSNSGINMTMSFNFGMVSAFFNRSGVWSGRYSVNGNQLVITVTSATGDYSGLQGMTYSYTITSETSFSGSGETWVRTGY